MGAETRIHTQLQKPTLPPPPPPAFQLPAHFQSKHSFIIKIQRFQTDAHPGEEKGTGKMGRWH